MFTHGVLYIYKFYIMTMAITIFSICGIHIRCLYVGTSIVQLNGVFCSQEHCRKVYWFAGAAITNYQTGVA